MVAKTADEVWGLEYDWLGCDAVGYVAFFSTAGWGYAPAKFLQDTDVHRQAIEAILELPETGSARFAPIVGPGCVNTWLLMAQRGLYAFDGDLQDGRYQLVADPGTPARVTQLPAIVADVARLIEFRQLHFAEVGVISEQTLRQ